VKILGRLRASTTRRAGQRGQSLIELAIAMPVVLILLLGMLEFGFAFSHHLTLEYATREGARYGAALAAGTAEVACTGADNVDAYVIAAVQRVLTGTGGQVPISQVTQIRIYKSDTSGNVTGGLQNLWVPGSGPTVDGTVLQFARSGGTNWDPCVRNNGANPDSIGVSLVYNYLYITPLGNFMGITGTAQLTISDKTIMALNPGAS
jgi:Flp pilus assembly protein TadG